MESFHADWLNDERRILLVTYPQSFTVKELFEFGNTVLPPLLDSVDHPVVLLTDVTEAVAPSDLLMSLSDLRRSFAFLKHPNYHAQIFYNVKSRLERIIVQLWCQVFDRRTEYAHLRDDAMARANELLAALDAQHAGAESDT